MVTLQILFTALGAKVQKKKISHKNKMQNFRSDKISVISFYLYFDTLDALPEISLLIVEHIK